MNKLIFCSLFALFTQIIFPQVVIANTSALESSIGNENNSYFKSNEGSSNLSVNIGELRTLLLSNSEYTIVNLPLPDGKLVKFKLTPENVMADELAKKYPNIKTFSGISLVNPHDIGRFDITPNGFHGMFYYQGKRVFVEPETVYITEQSALKSSKVNRVIIDENSVYKSYFSQENLSDKKLGYKFHSPKEIEQHSVKVNKASNAIESQSTIKTFRIAISAAAEYTAFHGGTVASTLAEIVTLVNRLNQVYQHDLAIKLELVENSDLLIFTDVNTDPFNNDSDDGDLNTDAIDSIIGRNNYDIGHVVNTDGGGLAVLGGVCDSTYKGDGVTGDATPINDSFYIDYVAHEIGHQFGANHTFNGIAGACEGNRVSHSAYEVGSGSTIMAYAGICGDQNIQSHSDAFFHARSIDQIRDNIEGGIGSTCGIASGAANNTPVVDAGTDYTIPAQTPFKLTGSAQDNDSASLTYSWQQYDLGEASSSLAEQVDDGTRPLFRAFSPSSDGSRNFPKLSDVLNGTTTIGETLPSTNRELNFRLMVFDDEGGVSFDETKLTVIDTGQAFSLNTPLTDDIWTVPSNNISWQVAATDIAPINCSTVDIILSKDNGITFDILLATNVVNNGSVNVNLDSFCADTINTAQARVKLECSNNIFYAVNNGAFSIDKALSSSEITITAQQNLSLVQGESITLNSSQFTYACQAADTISIQQGDNYSVLDETITPNSDFIGELQVSVIANKETVSSEIFMMTITVEAKPVPEPEPQPQPQPTTDSSSGSFYWLLLCICFLPLRKSYK